MENKHKYENYFVKRYEIPETIEATFQYFLDKDLPSIKFKDMLVTQQGCLSLFVLDFDNNFFLYFPLEEKERLFPFPIVSEDEPLVYGEDLTKRRMLFAYAYRTLALIYKKKTIQLFFEGEEKAFKELVFKSQPLAIVAEGKGFYVLLTNKKVLYLTVEGEILKDEVTDTTLFTDELSQYGKDLQGSAFGLDCFSNLWFLDKDSVLNHYIKTAIYEPFKEVKHTFDAFDEYTQWSNIYFEWEIPEGTKIEQKITIDDASERFENRDNILFYNKKAKELTVSLKLFSSEDKKRTPILKNIRVTFNTKPYIEYFPTYYQENSPETLSRYLSIFQELMGNLESEIEKSSQLLNPMLCDEEYLDWLSSLLGTVRDERWQEKKWRKFLSRLPYLYKILGTKKAMIEAIELYSGEGISIDDALNERWSFCVVFTNEKALSSRDIEVIESIIEAFKPAYTVGRLHFVHDVQNREEFIVGESFLSYNTTIK